MTALCEEAFFEIVIFITELCDSFFNRDILHVGHRKLRKSLVRSKASSV